MASPTATISLANRPFFGVSTALAGTPPERVEFLAHQFHCRAVCSVVWGIVRVVSASKAGLVKLQPIEESQHGDW
ncbi:MAG: hypothetical protein ABWY93_02125 [Mycobacterium sp.]